MTAALRMKKGTVSGSVALWGYLSSQPTWMPLFEYHFFLLSGMAVVYSAVNADSNCWFSMLALA